MHCVWALGAAERGRMSRESHVVIAGAGPVGLTAALLLGHKGIPVTLLEAEPMISEELRASTFHPPTLYAGWPHAPRTSTTGAPRRLRTWCATTRSTSASFSRTRSEPTLWPS